MISLLLTFHSIHVLFQREYWKARLSKGLEPDHVYWHNANCGYPVKLLSFSLKFSIYQGT